jgi:hypothetical protein
MPTVDFSGDRTGAAYDTEGADWPVVGAWRLQPSAEGRAVEGCNSTSPVWGGGSLAADVRERLGQVKGDSTGSPRGLPRRKTPKGLLPMVSDLPAIGKAPDEMADRARLARGELQP